MRVTVLFFGPLRDVSGRAADEIDVDEGATLGDLLERYAVKFPHLRDYEGSIVMARNREFSAASTAMAPGDEVAFLPPVSGGSSPVLQEIHDEEGHFFALTREPIDVAALKDRLRRGEDGAVVTFEGVVRNNSKGRATKFLDYECYEAMALEVIARIGREIAAGSEIGRVGIVHRLGRMEIGETSVAVVITAPHREPTFAAALEGINRVKTLAPIWKKEHFVDGAAWVEGEWDKSVLDR